MQNALRTDFYFYSTPFRFLLCKLDTWQSRWSSFSIWFSHSIHDLQLCIKNNHWRGDWLQQNEKLFDLRRWFDCIIYLTHILLLYLAPCPDVTRSIGPTATFRLKSVCPLGCHLNLDLVNHPLRDRESFQGVHMYTRVVPVTKKTQ